MQYSVKTLQQQDEPTFDEIQYDEDFEQQTINSQISSVISKTNSRSTQKKFNISQVKNRSFDANSKKNEYNRSFVRKITTESFNGYLDKTLDNLASSNFEKLSEFDKNIFVRQQIQQMNNQIQKMFQSSIHKGQLTVNRSSSEEMIAIQSRIQTNDIIIQNQQSEIDELQNFKNRLSGIQNKFDLQKEIDKLKKEIKSVQRSINLLSQSIKLNDRQFTQQGYQNHNELQKKVKNMSQFENEKIHFLQEKDNLHKQIQKINSQIQENKQKLQLNSKHYEKSVLLENQTLILTKNELLQKQLNDKLHQQQRSKKYTQNKISQLEEQYINDINILKNQIQNIVENKIYNYVQLSNNHIVQVSNMINQQQHELKQLIQPKSSKNFVMKQHSKLNQYKFNKPKSNDSYLNKQKQVQFIRKSNIKVMKDSKRDTASSKFQENKLPKVKFDDQINKEQSFFPTQQDEVKTQRRSQIRVKGSDNKFDQETIIENKQINLENKVIAPFNPQKDIFSFLEIPKNEEFTKNEELNKPESPQKIIPQITPKESPKQKPIKRFSRFRQAQQPQESLFNDFK